MTTCLVMRKAILDFLAGYIDIFDSKWVTSNTNILFPKSKITA